MEGLIPMVYKTIKKSRTRRHYEYLGSGGSAAQDYNNISDFYANNDRYMSMNGQKDAAAAAAAAAADHEKKIDGGLNNNAETVKGHHGHRRYQSFQLDYSGGFSPMDTTTAQSKKLVRFRSHNRFFSCVTGA